MVLRLKTWESRSLPNLKKILTVLLCIYDSFNAGWSSLVARQAHNLKVLGSNPSPATKLIIIVSREFNKIVVWLGIIHMIDPIISFINSVFK